ncbi:MAG: M56 family metallopeptidase [Thermoguttaceae bacterium]
MNTFWTVCSEWRSMVDSPDWVVLLLKSTAVLLAAWLIHLMLRWTNPRWRVFLWRTTTVGLIGLPVAAWLVPSLQIPVQPPLSVHEAVAAAPNDRVGPTVVERRWRKPPEDFSRAESTQSTTRSRNQPRKATSEPRSSAMPVADLLPTRWPFGLLGLWVGGLLILGARLCVGQYRLSRIVKDAVRAPQWVCDGCDYVARKIGGPDGIEVLESPEVASPFLCGLRRPRLLLPTRMCDDSYCKDLPGIFAHELAHVRSHDVLWNFGVRLISFVFWFHPLVWRMPTAHLAACELVCDAVSASFVGDVADYCRTLARVALDTRRSLPAAGLAMARASSVSRRLNALRLRVFHLPLRFTHQVSAGFAGLLAIAAIGALQFAMAAPSDGAVKKSKKAAQPSESASRGSEVFHLTPFHGLPSIPAADYYVGFIPLKPTAPSSLKGIPKCRAQQPLFGQLPLGVGPDNKFVVLVDETKDGTRIYVDQNRNHDLRDDSFHEGADKWTLDAPYPKGSVPCSIDLFRWSERPDFLVYRLETCREGVVRLAGRSYRVVVQDDGFLGRFDDLSNDLLLIDVNQDDEFEANRYVTKDDSSAEVFRADKPFNIGGKIWEVSSISPDGLEIAIRPSTAKVEEKRSLSAGSRAPDFTATDLDGKAFSLSDAAAKHQYVLLHFWVSTSHASENELRTLRRLDAQYKKSGLQIVGVNGDSDANAVRQTIEKLSIAYPQILDHRNRDKIKHLYRVLGNSYTFLIGNDMQIIDRGGSSHYARHFSDVVSTLQERLGPGDPSAASAEKKAVEVEKAHSGPFARDASIKKAACQAQGFRAVVVPRPAAWDQFDVRAVALRLPYVYVMSRANVPSPNQGMPANLMIAKISEDSVAGPKVQYVATTRCLSNGWDMMVRGDALLFATSTGVAAYSLADPANPKFAASAAMDKPADAINFVDHGSDLFLLCHGRFSVFDVVHPLTPRFLATMSFQPSGFSGCTVGDYLYVSVSQNPDGGREHGIMVYDIVDTVKPKAIGFVKTNGDLAYQVRAIDSKRLLVMATREMALFSLDDPKRPTILGSPVPFRRPRYSRTAAAFTANGKSFVILNGMIYSVEPTTLKKYGDFTWGGNVDGTPYRAAVQGRCIAIPSSAFVTLLFADDRSAL